MKKFIPLLILTLALFACQQKEIPNTLSIVPMPNEITVYDGSFTFSNETKVAFENIDNRDETILYFMNQFANYLTISPVYTTPENCKSNSILFSINNEQDENLGEEGYFLHITKKKIIVKANTSKGLVHAFATMIQSQPNITVLKTTANIFSSDSTIKEYISFPCLKVTDVPRFAWRGVHLDVCRHFFDVDFVKRYIDLLAMYKFNVFHWHLTDDHGWRIQIDKYPKLTSIGAWRPERPDKEWRNSKPFNPEEANTYGGFYTKDQIREVVAYAAARGIDVMPEIELPGHCSAILAAYPEFACDNHPYRVEVGAYWPPKAIMCGGNPKVMQFYKDVLDEVIPLFPFVYVHIGGDEAFKNNWEKCPKCLAKKQELNLENLEQLQGWMVRGIEDFLESKGKKMAGWVEIIEGGCRPNSLIYAWLHNEMTDHALANGNPIIQCPTSYCYLDYYQAEKSTQPDAIGGFIPMGKVYNYDPIGKEFTAEQAKQVMGVQFNLWAEFLFTPQQAEYMLLPRVLAGAEVAWCKPENKNWERFKTNLPTQKVRLKALGYHYCDDVVEEVK